MLNCVRVTTSKETLTYLEMHLFISSYNYNIVCQMLTITIETAIYIMETEAALNSKKKLKPTPNS